MLPEGSGKKASAPPGPAVCEEVRKGPVEAIGDEEQLKPGKWLHLPKGSPSVVLAGTLLLLGSILGLFLLLFDRRENGSGKLIDSSPSPTFSPTAYPANADGSTRCNEVELFTEIRNEDDYIGVIFLECPSPELFDAFVNAARRWSEIILINKIVPTTLQNIDFCFTRSSFQFNNDNVPLDHLVIYAQLIDLNDPFVFVTGSEPCLNDYLWHFPVLGVLRLENEKVPIMASDGTLETVVLHEMAHVLGFGILWQFYGQDGVGGMKYTYSPDERLLQDPIYPMISNSTAEPSEQGIEPNNHPRFVGRAALNEFRKLTGVNSSGIPVEDGSGKFDTSIREGFGIIDFHWSIEDFPEELMVYEILPSVDYKLSAMTIASLEDLGYSVDYTKADSYSLP